MDLFHVQQHLARPDPYTTVGAGSLSLGKLHDRTAGGLWAAATDRLRLNLGPLVENLSVELERNFRKFNPTLGTLDHFIDSNLWMSGLDMRFEMAKHHGIRAEITGNFGQ